MSYKDEDLASMESDDDETEQLNNLGDLIEEDE
jgi:hypothetical protein